MYTARGEVTRPRSVHYKAVSSDGQSYYGRDNGALRNLYIVVLICLATQLEQLVDSARLTAGLTADLEARARH